MHKLFLFPGAHKTGTTLLQSALEINRQLLEEQHFALIGRKPYYSSKCCEYLRKYSHKRSTSVSISGARQSLIDLCDGNIDRNIILSIENIFGEFRHDPHMCHASKPVLEALQSMLPLHEINVTYYVRRQDTYFESIFIQRVQKLHNQSFVEFYNERKNADLRWKPKLDSMAHTLDNGQLKVIPFESIKAGSDRYIRNMFSLFSPQLAKQVSLKQLAGHQSNLSLSGKGVELALTLFPHIQTHERQLFMKFLRSHFSKRDYPKAQLLDDEAREHILSKVRTDNEMLFNKYMGQRTEKSYYLEHPLQGMKHGWKNMDVKQLILESGYFDADWYCQQYPDVQISQIPPLDHFLKYGLLLNRNPSIRFDSGWYKNINTDVALAGVNPLIHYLTDGAKEGRKIKGVFDRCPHFKQTPGIRYPQRILQNWDEDRESYFIEKMEAIYSTHKADISEIKISVVMPTFNRAGIIGKAIESVQRQQHENFELLIVDDGSTDDTAEVVTGYASADPRVKYISGKHEGVSAARNIGLRHSKGRYIFYLDTDNTWFENHVRLLLTFMHVFDVGAAYCGSVCMNDSKSSYYRGDDFNWNRCHELNYLDMNSFAHKASLLELTQGFDESLERLVDWDLILRLTTLTSTVFLPFIGVSYFDGDEFCRITRNVAVNGEILELQSRIRSKSKRKQPIAVVDESKYPVAEAFLEAVKADDNLSKIQELVALNPDVVKNLSNYPQLSLAAANREKNLISIIIVCFNKSELTRECIKSVFRASGSSQTNIEVIIVDNGSTDDTQKVVTELALQFPEIVYLRNATNMMFSMGNNIGAARSKGEYLVFLNNDTLVSPGWLEPLKKALFESPGAGIAGPKLLYPDDTVQCAGIVFSEHSSMPYHIYRGFHKDDKCVNQTREYKALTGACLMMQAAEFFEVDGFDTRFVNGCEDIDLCLKYSARFDKKICYVAESEIYHLEGKTEGRGKYIAYNRELLFRLWGTITADDKSYYEKDGYQVLAYEKRGSEDHGPLAAYSPILESSVYDQNLTDSTLNKAQSQVNIGFVSIWHVRGISIHTLQLANALECDEIKTHVFARWEADRFSNSHPVFHPRVENGGDDPSAATLVKWCKSNQIKTLVFMEVHPKDWKRVEEVKRAGIKIIGYENLDILRREHIEKYEIFDAFLFNTFYTRDVMLNFFPNKPSMTLPWGIEQWASKDMQDSRIGNMTQFLHVAGWGGVNNRKNTSLLIEAFDAAGDISGELHVYTQSPVASWGQHIRNICVDNSKIHVHEGTIDNIQQAYEGKDMLLWPSKKEGVGLPILESLMYGVPVLISDGYMMKQWIKPDIHGLVCAAEPVNGPMYLPEMAVDRSELTNLIIKVTEDNDLLAALKKNIKMDQRTWEWGWQKMVIKDLFQKFNRNPNDPVFQALHYIPRECIEFENERRALFGEPALKLN